jgi:3-hydroxymyristoyl/3-hydroxydecanoyl-(acyl carrier protein) dehydratase
MDGRFAAYSFVDRITALDPGRHIRGRYLIPAGVPAFPAALVGEAIGQLAAWAAMAALDFTCRPVAGLAASVNFRSAARPGQVLELTADLETVDQEAVAYRGTAHIDGQSVMDLQDCVGPMLPIEQFDDPQAVRARFELLRQTDAAPGAFSGVEPLTLEETGREEGKLVRATLHVPGTAPFFADHFPRRPVLPGTLLLNSSFELVALLSARLPGAADNPWVLRSVSDVKLRAFTPPGGTLAMEARLIQLSADTAFVNVEARDGKRLVGGARAQLGHFLQTPIRPGGREDPSHS